MHIGNHVINNNEEISGGDEKIIKISDINKIIYGIENTIYGMFGYDKNYYINELKNALEKGIDYENGSAAIPNPLFMAIKRDYIDVVKLLIEKKNTLMVQLNNFNNSNSDRTPLCYAFEEGKQEILKLMTEKEEYINLVDPLTGNTQLHIAATYINEKYLKFLLEQPKININILNNEKKTPFYLIIENFKKITSNNRKYKMSEEFKNYHKKFLIKELLNREDLELYNTNNNPLLEILLLGDYYYYVDKNGSNVPYLEKIDDIKEMVIKKYQERKIFEKMSIEDKMKILINGIYGKINDNLLISLVNTYDIIDLNYVDKEKRTFIMFYLEKKMDNFNSTLKDEDTHSKEEIITFENEVINQLKLFMNKHPKNINVELTKTFIYGKDNTILERILEKEYINIFKYIWNEMIKDKNVLKDIYMDLFSIALNTKRKDLIYLFIKDNPISTNENAFLKNILIKFVKEVLEQDTTSGEYVSMPMLESTHEDNINISLLELIRLIFKLTKEKNIALDIEEIKNLLDERESKINNRKWESESDIEKEFKINNIKNIRQIINNK